MPSHRRPPNHKPAVIVISTGIVATLSTSISMLFLWSAPPTRTQPQSQSVETIAPAAISAPAATKHKSRKHAHSHVTVKTSAPTPTACVSTTRQVTANSGDTYSTIAQTMYGDPSQYQLIEQANQWDDSSIPVGATVIIPPDCSG